MRPSIVKQRAAELERIRRAAGGVLRPEDVVAAARPRRSILHEWFEWRDDKAAEAYRLWQARELIQVCVRVLAPRLGPSRIYVSLVEDRGREGGGYRAVVDVLRDPDLRAGFLAEALEDLRRWEAKYRRLRELAAVFRAAKAARHRLRRRERRTQNAA